LHLPFRSLTAIACRAFSSFIRDTSSRSSAYLKIDCPAAFNLGSRIAGLGDQIFMQIFDVHHQSRSELLSDNLQSGALFGRRKRVAGRCVVQFAQI